MKCLPPTILCFWSRVRIGLVRFFSRARSAKEDATSSSSNTAALRRSCEMWPDTICKMLLKTTFSSARMCRRTLLIVSPSFVHSWVHQ